MMDINDHLLYACGNLYAPQSILWTRWCFDYIDSRNFSRGG